MEKNNLLKLEDKIYAVNLSGLAYIKSSKGNSSNVYFTTSCVVNTKDNSVKVEYTVEAFESGWVDYVCFKTTNYQEAVDKYNELAIKWNGYRDINNNTTP
jgi:hypothetical protein